MSTAVQTRTRDPRIILNQLQERVPHLVTDVGVADLWEREVQLLLRDSVAVRSLAERILGQGIAYLITAMESPGVDMGVGYTVDIGVHQIILDTPLYFALCEEYNGGVYKHHAPLIERRCDGTVTRTADIIRGNGFVVDEELWAVDASTCSPCDNKVPDSH
ncbi:hypothetical protein IPZ58_06470 [Streptomyces roseoverticillatus]|uniref:hypothetical protein n=1 Tax=Streptomyces roseoverticillatus TaxID=66429 RepID=UPI001F33516B|nr:hypothetical protein [Streptomyces roseoverticillatus]MCF3101224.1 hypothetical protein [Streptomyces roseoverticillatus]